MMSASLSATLFREGDDLDVVLAELDEEHPGQVRVVDVTYGRDGGVLGFFARRRVGVRYALDGADATETSIGSSAVRDEDPFNLVDGFGVRDQVVSRPTPMTHADDDTMPLGDLVRAVEAAEAAEEMVMSGRVPARPVLESVAAEPGANVEFARMLLDLAVAKAAKRQATESAELTAGDADDVASFATAPTVVAEEIADFAAILPPPVAQVPFVAPIVSAAIMSASVAPMPVAPMPVAPMPVAPMPVAPMPVAPSSFAAVAPTPPPAVRRRATTGNEVWTAPPPRPATQPTRIPARTVRIDENTPTVRATPPAPSMPAPSVDPSSSTPAPAIATSTTAADPAPSTTAASTTAASSTPSELAASSIDELLRRTRTRPIGAHRDAIDHPGDTSYTLRRQLIELGVPVPWIPEQGNDRYRLVEHLVGQLPAPRAIVTRPGQLVVVVGPAIEAIQAATRLCATMRLDPEQHFYVAGDVARVPADRRISQRWQASELAARVRAEHSMPAIVLVATDDLAGADDQDDTWAADIVAALAPDELYLVIDAAAKPTDVRTSAATYAPVTALAVAGAARTMSPASIWELGLPIALLDGRRCTPGVWTALLLDKLDALEP